MCLTKIIILLFERAMKNCYAVVVDKAKTHPHDVVKLTTKLINRYFG